MSDVAEQVSGPAEGPLVGAGVGAGAGAGDGSAVGLTVDDLDTPAVEGADEQIAFDLSTFPGGARSAIEAVLMVVDEPVTELSLASALELPVEDVLEHLRALEEQYAADQRGFTLRSVAGGWRVYSRPEFAPVVEKFVLDGQQARLTQASLETLAVIAYRQPVSRARVSAVRGVNVDGVVRTLVSRGLIEEIDDVGESGAVLYRTTTFFLQRMGLSSLDELPALAPYLPDVDVIDELIEEGHR
jgi:segregation and condensation protein B